MFEIKKENIAFYRLNNHTLLYKIDLSRYMHCKKFICAYNFVNAAIRRAEKSGEKISDFLK